MAAVTAQKEKKYNYKELDDSETQGYPQGV
jgi:hypothetical protein